ncbi:hypothetical protein GOP47_0018737 [Adiantum capillus-veneris]|uniref:Uncharacterized protein n=1 Tax=Adiantum capillus-veneris TaxID=13818 RepID=A0A9D4Z8F4_ADICA|nr:hypothetical protein GOP47_0018737 [Adiantum capillus-veneris]
MEVVASSLHVSPLAGSTWRATVHADKNRIPVRARQGPAVKAKWPFALVLGVAVLLHPGPDSSDDLALAFDWFGNSSSSIQKDPVEPFTLYGSVFKKYLIENIVEGKVVSRRKGFTSTACVNALDADKETPELQGILAGLKVIIIGEPKCAKSEGQSREETCFPSCKVACRRAIEQHLAEVTKETGYVLDSKDKAKVIESCGNQCANECLKPGKTTSQSSTSDVCSRSVLALLYRVLAFVPGVKWLPSSERPLPCKAIQMFKEYIKY